MKNSAAWMMLTVILLFAFSGSAVFGKSHEQAQKKIPVIYDTDIGGDIDDTWALALLLRCPELDVKLVTTEVGDTTAKAQIVAKFLDTMGRGDIPIGIGIREHKNGHRQTAWSGDYDLSEYPGKIYEDGAQALVDTLNKSSSRMKVIAVGPVPTLAAALEKDAGIARKAVFVGMHGSVRRGYGGKSEPDPEYNVRANAKAVQTVFAAPWKKKVITPLDTCGLVHLKGERYQKIVNRDSRLTKALLANYRAWYRARQPDNLSEDEVDKRVNQKVGSSSTTLFDTVAIYLAISKKWVKMENLPIKVTDDGFTRIDKDAGVRVHCAMEWKDMDAFKDWMVKRLTK